MIIEEIMNDQLVTLAPDDEIKKVFRIQTMNPTMVIEELKKAGYEVLWPNLPGVIR